MAIITTELVKNTTAQLGIFVGLNGIVISAQHFHTNHMHAAIVFLCSVFFFSLFGKYAIFEFNCLLVSMLSHFYPVYGIYIYVDVDGYQDLYIR